jgi:hypothetical protein
MREELTKSKNYSNKASGIEQKADIINISHLLALCLVEMYLMEIGREIEKEK